MEHFKKECKGILLVALGQDSVRHFYPFDWAVVDRKQPEHGNGLLSC